MYYHRSRRNRNHKGRFPWFFFIPIAFIMSGVWGFNFIFWIIVFIAIKWLVVSSNSRTVSTAGINRQVQTPQSRSSRVPVNYVDTLEPHEDPSNYTRASAYCFECGTAIGLKSKFCSFCGTAQI